VTEFVRGVALGLLKLLESAALFGAVMFATWELACVLQSPGAAMQWVQDTIGQRPAPPDEPSGVQLVLMAVGVPVAVLFYNVKYRRLFLQKDNVGATARRLLALETIAVVSTLFVLAKTS
jgi:hypothetical protein